MQSRIAATGNFMADRCKGRQRFNIELIRGNKRKSETTLMLRRGGEAQ
jgi:hypothetical protein